MTNIVILSDKRGRQVGPPGVGEVVGQLDLFIGLISAFVESFKCNKLYIGVYFFNFYNRSAI